MTEKQRNPITVAVIFGGRSSEHAVSCASAASVMKALDPARYRIVPIGITTAGQWVLESPDPERFAIGAGQLPHVDAGGTGVALVGDPTVSGSLVVLGDREIPDLGGIDVVFPVLHGAYGEDGTIQGLLELAGIPYVGAGVLASAAGMDKDVMKRLFAEAGLPIGRYETITDRQWRTDKNSSLARAEALGFPVFVKPARAGSSIGITRVDSAAGLEQAIETARAIDPKILVEAAIAGREIECGVLEGIGLAAPDASVPGEVLVRAREFYDFEAKYLDDSADLTVPADLSPQAAATVKQLAIAAFETLGCEGLSRVDFFVDDTHGEDRVIINEVNTMPGFTAKSMFALLWKATGLDYPALVDRLIATALNHGTGLR